MPSSISPSQRSPFLYLIRNFLLPRSSFSIYSQSFSISYELFVYSSCQAGTGSSISAGSYNLGAVIGCSTISSSSFSSSFLGLGAATTFEGGGVCPKKVLQLILVSLKNSQAYSLNSSSPNSSLILRISLSSMASPPSPISRSIISTVGLINCWQMLMFSSMCLYK